MATSLTQEVVEAAFEWLTGSSDDISNARAQVLRMEYKAKRVQARLFLNGTGSIESRKAQALDSDEYANAMENYFEAVKEWERMDDQRDRARTIIEAWRTASATERAIGRATR
jgi:hypothetical protein